MKWPMLHAVQSVFFPHTCAACGTNKLPDNAGICSACLYTLPETGFTRMQANEVEKIFYGRLTLEHAAASTYFTQKSIVQEILHQLKYSYRKELGLQLGEWMGFQLRTANWMSKIDCLLPMPLHPKRKAVRGYNQAELLAKGIEVQTGLPAYSDCLERITPTRSQTTQHRSERWQNMREVFKISKPSYIEHKHVLLIDDVITTGATLEAMGEKILQVPGTKLSLFCFAYTLPH
ncbi:MAG: ComF family protein [Flavipsychrobacter sp.]|jgi:ComF family protein|nr:ComF family protein [Flavipsychrobacter sp.]